MYATLVVVCKTLDVDEWGDVFFFASSGRALEHMNNDNGVKVNIYVDCAA